MFHLVRFTLIFLALTSLSLYSFSQLSEDFSDDDLSNNPSWTSSNASGNGVDFEVSTGELQSNGPSASSNIWISSSGIPNLSSGIVTWTFKVRYSSAPSSSNTVQIFLVSDRADLSDNPKGYFIRLGESGSNDGIDLFKTSSGTAIILDPNPSVASGIDVNVRVTREVSGLWILEAGPAGGTSYSPIGTVTDDEFVVGDFFGFNVNHTSTKNRSFFFDDVSVVLTDAGPPAIVDIAATSDHELKVIFSEEVDVATGENAANYYVDDGIGAPTTATIKANDNRIVHLTFPAAFLNAQTHVLTVNNVEDLAGNAIINAESEFFYFKEDPATVKDIVINEIFPDPDPPNDLPQTEFVEILNTSDKIFDLSGWTLSDLSTETVLNKFFIASKEFLILCPIADTALFKPYGNVMGIHPWPSLNNTGDLISLKDNHGITVDSVNYSRTWFGNAEKKDGGWSLELINPENLCHSVDNWTPSTNTSGGTPGQQNSAYDPAIDEQGPVLLSAVALGDQAVKLFFNETLDPVSVTSASFSLNTDIEVDSVVLDVNLSEITCYLSEAVVGNTWFIINVNDITDCSGNIMDTDNSAEFIYVATVEVEERDVVINEIFPNPGDEGGLSQAEYIELFNNSDKILNLDGWSFSDGGGTTDTLSSLIIFPGDYAILCAASDAPLFQDYGTVSGLAVWPVLNNSGDAIVLRDGSGKRVDSVSYKSSWYTNPSKSGGGWSLELINPHNLCKLSENWSASTDDSGGTPGTVNSIYAEDTISPMLSGAVATGEISMDLFFDEALDPASVDEAEFQTNGSFSVISGTINDDLKRLSCQLSSPIPANEFFTITVDGLSDCSGNLIGTDNSAEFIYVANFELKERDVVINEIFPNPGDEGGLPQAEYVELLNNSDKILNLDGWSISDGGTIGTITNLILFPGDYAILCAAADAPLLQDYGLVKGLAVWPVLNNSGDAIVIKDSSGQRIDSVSYKSSWYKSSSKSAGGWSLELIDPHNFCNLSDNWSASTDDSGGTPGSLNAVYGEDKIAPVVLSAVATGALTIELLFDEPLNRASISEAEYQTDGNFAVDSVILKDTNNELVCRLSEAIPTNKTFTITVGNLSDCSGNVIGTDNSAEFIYVAPVEVEEKDVVINEIFPNPNDEGGILQTEYVELFNNSDKILNLDGWSFSDGGTTDTLSSVIIFPDDYAILCAASDAPLFQDYGTVSGLALWPVLNNSGDAIVLRDNSGKRIDSVNYESSWFISSSKSAGGWSLELIDPANHCSDRRNWATSEDASGGSPGRGNSVLSEKPDLNGPELTEALGIAPDRVLIRFNELLDPDVAVTGRFFIEPEIGVTEVKSDDNLMDLSLYLLQPLERGISYKVTAENVYDCSGNKITGPNHAQFQLIESADSADVVINEILFNPRTSGVDFVELYNRSEKYLNMQGWLVANGKGKDGVLEPDKMKVITNDNYIIEPGGFRALTTDAVVLKEQYPFGEEHNFLEVDALPGFRNDEGSVIIMKRDSTWLDFAEYTSGWHHSLLSDEKGVSLERVSVDESAKKPDNWKSAASKVGFATPGYANSQARPELIKAKGKIVIDPEIVIPDGSGQNDFATINYAFEQPGNIATVKIMDMHGRVVKVLGENDYLPAQGFYTWDATNETGAKSRVGYYLVYFEVFDTKGQVQYFKEKVVVGTRF